jgi:hypothetical protein
MEKLKRFKKAISLFTAAALTLSLLMYTPEWTAVSQAAPTQALIKSLTYNFTAESGNAAMSGTNFLVTTSDWTTLTAKTSVNGDKVTATVSGFTSSGITELGKITGTNPGDLK